MPRDESLLQDMLRAAEQIEICRVCIAHRVSQTRKWCAVHTLRDYVTPDPEIDAKWAQVAQRRLAELRAGAVKAVPGEQVFAQIWKSVGWATRCPC